MATKKKERRKQRSREEKQALVDGLRAAQAQDPGLSMKAYARSVGVPGSVLLRWAQGKALGRVGGAPPKKSAETAAVYARSRALRAPAQPGGEWLARHGAVLQAQMGVESRTESTPPGETLVSSGPESGPPEAPPAPSKRKYVRKSDPFLPRQVAITRPNEPRQPTLPFGESPLPVARARPEERPEQQEFMHRVTEQALKERDAFKTVLEVFMRDNGLKFPGQ